MAECLYFLKDTEWGKMEMYEQNGVLRQNFKYISLPMSQMSKKVYIPVLKELLKTLCINIPNFSHI